MFHGSHFFHFHLYNYSRKTTVFLLYLLLEAFSLFLLSVTVSFSCAGCVLLQRRVCLRWCLGRRQDARKRLLFVPQRKQIRRRLLRKYLLLVNGVVFTRSRRACLLPAIRNERFRCSYSIVLFHSELLSFNVPYRTMPRKVTVCCNTRTEKDTKASGGPTSPTVRSGYFIYHSFTFLFFCLTLEGLLIVSWT